MLHFLKRSDGPVVSLPAPSPPVVILERPSRRPRWRTFVTPACLVVALLLLLFLLGGEAVPWGWDDSFYRAQTSSLVEDGDVDLRDDLLAAPADPALLLRALTSLEPRGTLNNDFPVGSALVWMPAYVGGRAADLAAAAPAPRWSAAQALALDLSSLGLTLAVLFFLERWLRFAGCPRGWSTATALLLLVGTPLGFYAVSQYANSHLGATAAVCLMLAALVELDRRPTAWSAAGVGIALGFCALLRFQDALLAFALLPPLLALARRQGWRPAARLAAWAVGAGLVVANLQALAWWRERGEIFSVPQGEGFIAWSSPELWPFLFSGVAGVALWAPLLLVGVAGLCMPWRSRLPRSWR